MSQAAGAGRLAGKVALVSAAAHGIGEAVARRFASEGARLCANDLDGAALEALAKELRPDGVEIETVAGDASDPGWSIRGSTPRSPGSAASTCSTTASASPAPG